jgi:hypothetical protein
VRVALVAPVVVVVISLPAVVARLARQTSIWC